MNAAHDIIRFEVQCKYHNVYARSRKVKAGGNSDVNLYKNLLSHEVCVDVICNYFYKTIGKGHWYSLQAAISLIKSHNFNIQKENRLIDALYFVNQCRSVAKAKEDYQGDDLAAFKRTLKDLNNLGINPVTIPKDWGIDRIWSLLDAYSCKKSEEDMRKQFDEEVFQDKKLMKHLLAH